MPRIPDSGYGPSGPRNNPSYDSYAPNPPPGYPARPVNNVQPMYNSYGPVPGSAPPGIAQPGYESSPSETETSKLEVEENTKSSAASYALPIGLLAMLILVVAASML